MRTPMKYRVPAPLPLKGTGNTRELGGYPGVDGRFTREHTLLRSDSLSRLAEEDIQFLTEYGVSCVIDLRTEEEVENHPSIFSENNRASYYHVPFSDRLDFCVPGREPVKSMAGLYIRLLEQQGSSYAEFFRTILNHRGETVIFHCAAGKDRTGVAAMLLLMTAGVPCSLVIADYGVSESNMKDIFEVIWKADKDTGKGIPEFAYASREEDMVATMAYLLRKWGSAQEYLKANNVLQSEIDAFKEYFLV